VRVAAAVRAHLGTGQVARVIYGSIIGLALILALEQHPPGPGSVIGSLLATALAVGLAEVYSEALGAEVRLRRRITRAELEPLLDDLLAVSFGIAFPAVFFVLAAAGAIEEDTAFDIAEWSGLGLIAFYGAAAAKLAGASHSGALVRGLLAGLIAVVLIVLKAVLH
jgi:hypothetical protein